MILSRYVSFRRAFALPGATIEPDGLPHYPSDTKLRTGGFSGTLCVKVGSTLQPLSVQTGWYGAANTPTTFPLTLTCNAEAADAVSGVHEYAWWVSQRIDDDRGGHDKQCLVVYHANPAKSGTITLDTVEIPIIKILPTFVDLFDEESAPILFRNVHVYVQRLSDKAIQWARLYKAD